MDMKSLLTLSVFLALVREHKGEKPEVSVLPKFPQLFVGDDITLVCKGGNGETNWFIDDKQQSHQGHLMLLTTVISENNGVYRCERGGSKSDPKTINVLELEPHAQLSPSVGGAVMTKGEGRNLVLQVDDHEELRKWTCFVLRGESGNRLTIRVDQKMKRAILYGELREAERATFWCLNKETSHRSNAVTLKMTKHLVILEPPAVPALQGETVALRCVVWGGGKVEKATFTKNQKEIQGITKETLNITKATKADSGKYSCHATFRYSHISADAAQREGDSDPQEIKVINGAPASTLTSSESLLSCSCPQCPNNCTSYHWYHTLFNDPYARRRLPEKHSSIHVSEKGLYSCRKACGNGFSRFSNLYSYEVSEPVSVLPIVVAGCLMVVGVLIVVLIALKRRRRGGSSVQETKRDKNKAAGGDYEQIQLKDSAVYHTLGEGTSKDKGEGGYEALQKRPAEAVYHTLAPGQAQGQGEGGYEALKNVKVEVYQTLSSGSSEKPSGEAEGGYEQLPQTARDCEAVNVEENPYEELKAEKQKMKQSRREKKEGNLEEEATH